MSESIERTAKPSSSSIWIVGGLLFLLGSASGGWVAYRWVRPPTSAATGVSTTIAAPPSNDDKRPVHQLKQNHVPPQTIPVLHQPKRSLRYQGPVRLTEAILLNGGAQPQSNYFSHHLHIKMLRETLMRRGMPAKSISIFSSDGMSSEPDQVISASLPFSWMFSGINEEQIINGSRLVNTVLKGHRMQPAKNRLLGRQIKRIARRLRKRKRPSTVFLFVTDHGTKGRGPLGNKIAMWNEELNVRQLQRMLRPFGKKHRFVTVMSQCYSGGFANLLYTRRWRVHGNRCGFYSTLANREAYGCFPETAKADRVGHAYRFIRSLRDARTFQEAHLQTLTDDQTPDVPISTSDIYIEDVLRRMARRKRRKLQREVDRILRKVWGGVPSWLRAEQRVLLRLESTFHLKKYKYLRDVWRDIRLNRNAIKQIDQVGGVWKQVWSDVQRGTLVGFYQKNPGLASLVQREMNRPDIDEKTRRIGRRLYLAFRKYVKQHAPESKRLKRLYKRFDMVQKQSHLYHVHEAALLRVAMRLTRMAGLYHFHTNGKKRERRALKQLMTCESTAIGGQPFQQELRAEGPSGNTGQSTKMARGPAKKRQPVAALSPSRLGISFGQAPKGWHSTFDKNAPGAVYIRQVDPDTPAAKAGLKVGDIIVSVGGQMLHLESEIRDLVMLASSQKKTFFMVYRNGNFRTIPVQLASLSGDADDTAPSPPIGMAPGQPNGSRGGTPFDDDSQPNTPPPGFHDSLPPGYNSDPNTRVYGLRRRAKRPSRRTVPSSALKTIDGQAIAFPNQNKVTLLFFWATWCEGCKAMVPMLRRLRQRYRRRKFQLLAVTSDTPRMLRPFKRKWGRRFPFRIAIDQHARFNRKYNITTIPELMLFSKDGKLLFRSSHPSSRQLRRLHRLIRKHSR